MYNNIETIILSFIVNSITYKKSYFYHKKMEVMDNTVIQNNYPKAKKRVKWAIFLYIKQDKIMVSFF